MTTADSTPTATTAAADTAAATCTPKAADCAAADGNTDSGMDSTVPTDAATATATATADATSQPTASKFSIKLSGLDKHLTQKDIKKALEKASICNAIKIKKVHKMTFAIVSFPTEEDQTNALKQCQAGLVDIKKSPGMTVELYDPSTEQPKISHRELQDSNNNNSNSRKRGRDNDDDVNGKEDVVDDRTPQEKINDQVIPWWRKPYPDQLKEKTLKFKNSLGRLKNNLLKFLNNRDVLPERKQALRYIGKERLCPLEDTVASPIIEGYRTKCEFTMGFDMDGKKSVGFLLGLFKDGITTVLPPTDCLNVSEKAKLIAKSVEDFINNSSDLDVYDRVKKKGFWRLMQVRTQHTGEIMVIIQVNPVDTDEATRLKARSDFVASFQTLRETGVVDVTTILWQECDGSHNGISDKYPFTVIYGPGYIHEELLGMRFRISPSAFFQVNTPAAEILYSKVRDWCALDEIEIPAEPSQPDVSAPAASTTAAAATIDNAEATTETTETVPEIAKETAPATETATVNDAPGIVLLDLCCGTGTIGLLMASSVKKVIGVEMVPSAIEDAQYNAQLNNLTHKTVYMVSKVEDAMRAVLSKEHVGPRDVVVAVLDPPRVGVTHSVIQAIRGCERIDRVVFVSCDFEAALTNFVDLCRPTSNKYQGEPFKPLRAVPYDLFPHTPHCELVMELRRLPPSSPSAAPVSEKEITETSETPVVETTGDDTLDANVAVEAVEDAVMEDAKNI